MIKCPNCGHEHFKRLYTLGFVDCDKCGVRFDVEMGERIEDESKTPQDIIEDLVGESMEDMGLEGHFEEEEGRGDKC